MTISLDARPCCARHTVNLRPRVVMIMYLPAGAAFDMGPTAIYPKSCVTAPPRAALKR